MRRAWQWYLISISGLVALSCASLQPQGFKTCSAQVYRMRQEYMDLKEQYDLRSIDFDQEAAKFKNDKNILKQVEDHFMASLTDEKLGLYSLLKKAVAEGNKPAALLARRSIARTFSAQERALLHQIIAAQEDLANRKAKLNQMAAELQQLNDRIYRYGKGLIEYTYECTKIGIMENVPRETINAFSNFSY